MSFRLTSSQPRSLKTLRQASASFTGVKSVTRWRLHPVCQWVSAQVTSRHNNRICVGYYPVRIDSAVGTTGWTVWVSNPDGGEIFRTCPDRPWGPLSLLCNWYKIFPGGKAAGVWLWPPTPSSVEVKERIEIYLDSPFVPLWPVLGWTLLYPFLVSPGTTNALTFVVVFHQSLHANDGSVGVYLIIPRHVSASSFKIHVL